MAESRLFQMVYLLLEKGTMTAPALAEHFEVSVRTIYRDIDALSGAGIPVFATPGKGGGISIQESFVLSKSLLTEQEQAQIMMALQGIHMVDAESTAALLSKLSGAFQRQNVRWIEVDFSEWEPSRRARFDALKSAIFAGKRVSFLYHNVRGEAARRLVEPLKLVFRSRDWFLYGYCCLRGGYRLFKLTRIKALETTDEAFTREVPAQVFAEMEAPALTCVQLTLLFEPEMAYQVYDHFADVEPQADGRLLVQAEMPENAYLYSHLLSYGDKAEVLAPMSARQEMQARIDKMQGKYKT